jgi:hypothetical protein
MPHSLVKIRPTTTLQPDFAAGQGSPQCMQSIFTVVKTTMNQRQSIQSAQVRQFTDWQTSSEAGIVFDVQVQQIAQLPNRRW